jgi:hypothetical protein
MWRRLHNKLYSLYFSPNIWVIKKNKIGEACGRLMEGLGVDGSIILEFILKMWIGEACTGLI